MIEARASGNLIATAKRHGIQAWQIYRWRERLEAHSAPAASCPSRLFRTLRHPVRHPCWMIRAGIAIQPLGRIARRGWRSSCPPAVGSSSMRASPSTRCSGWCGV